MNEYLAHGSPCTISDSVQSLYRVWESIDEIVRSSPSEYPVIRLAGLALIGELALNYSQEYFTFEEIELIESVYDYLSENTGEHLYE